MINYTILGNVSENILYIEDDEYFSQGSYNFITYLKKYLNKSNEIILKFIVNNSVGKSYF